MKVSFCGFVVQRILIRALNQSISAKFGYVKVNWFAGAFFSISFDFNSISFWPFTFLNVILSNNNQYSFQYYVKVVNLQFSRKNSIYFDCINNFALIVIRLELFIHFLARTCTRFSTSSKMELLVLVVSNRLQFHRLYLFFNNYITTTLYLAIII